MDVYVTSHYWGIFQLMGLTPKQEQCNDYFYTHKESYYLKTCSLSSPPPITHLKTRKKTSLKHAFENRAIDSDSTATIELFIRNNYATTESDKKR
jgi:hypothetical protein